MSNHDSFKDIQDMLKNEEIIRKISPKFDEETLDIQEIMGYSKDPMFIAVLLYKLVQERGRTNQLLEKIHDKFDEIMLELKTKELAPGSAPPAQQAQKASAFEVLPEQDQMIIAHVKQAGQATAEDIKAMLGYRGVNAASQRLNKLFREGYLQKVQSGRKVLFLAKNV